MLTYAVKATAALTQTTYMRGFGPTGTGLETTDDGRWTMDDGLRRSTLEHQSSSLHISAVISANYGTTTGAVYSIDSLPEDGEGTIMTLNGQNASATADTSGLAPGRHTVFVQGSAA